MTDQLNSITASQCENPPARVRITHRLSGELIADGPLGWRDIMLFEGNYYVANKHLATDGFKTNYIPGLCFYKFIYVWLNFTHSKGTTKNLGWRYVIPNPLFPFIWFRVAVPALHPELDIAFEPERRGES